MTSQSKVFHRLLVTTTLLLTGLILSLIMIVSSLAVTLGVEAQLFVIGMEA